MADLVEFQIIVIIFACMENIKNSRVLETENTRFEIKDGILYGKYREGLVITLEVAKDIVKNRMKFSENNSYPIIVFTDGMKSISKEARDYLGGKEGSAGIIAGAVVTKSVYTTFIGNFFLKVNKPPLPTKMFTDVKDAVEWLEQYKPKAVSGNKIIVT